MSDFTPMSPKCAGCQDASGTCFPWPCQIYEERRAGRELERIVPSNLSNRLNEAADWLAEELPSGVVAPQFLEGDVKLDELDAYCIAIMREAATALATMPGA